MNNGKTIEDLGVPDIRLIGLQIGIHSREHPEGEGFRDSDRLNVMTHCGAKNAGVWASGSILRSEEIAAWLVALEEAERNFVG